MYKHRVGFGFCSHFDAETEQLSEYEPLYESGVLTGRLALFPTDRINGYHAAYRLKLIDTLVLMGPTAETAAYRNRLLRQGFPLEKLDSVETGNSTRDAALTLLPELEARKLRYGSWCVLSSDYHIRRIELTARLLHNFSIPKLYGAEQCLLQLAFREGGEAEQKKLIGHLCQHRNAKDDLLRRLYEEKGCAQLIEDAESYKPKKK